jgi:glycosyltransferase involved in cell wall biosynthesis
MSIQNAISNDVLKYKILSKFRLLRFYDYFFKILQILSRKFISFFLLNKDHEKVFFSYYSHFSHPQLKKRFYGKEAPQYWSTLESSKIVHCLQHSRPEYSGKKIIIEPNDNCLIIGGFLNTSKADELVSRVKEINDHICSSAVARILVGSDELLNHASYYYSSDALKKFITYPQMACVSAVTRNYLSQKNNKLLSKSNIKYLSIASDFKIKAVDLLIEAFSESHSSSELTLVCHNVPENLRQKILANKNIFLIEDLPLSNKKKDQLYRDSDVYINTTYIDGGSTAWNALEYGLPIITHTYHRGKGLVENKNGILLSEPVKYYEPEYFGVHWKDMVDYLEQVDLLKKKGEYTDVQNQLVNAFRYYEKNPNNVFEDGVRSLELAQKNSLENSNKALRRIYKEVASERI